VPFGQSPLTPLLYRWERPTGDAGISEITVNVRIFIVLSKRKPELKKTGAQGAPRKVVPEA
jgi:hypothetical protein